MRPATFQKVSPGVFIVRYDSEDDLLPDRQKALLDSVRGEGIPSAIVFVLAPQIWKVDLSVPQFWAQVVRDTTLPLRAIAVVSESVAVRAATHTFRVATLLTNRNLAVSSQHEEASAVRWAKESLSARAAPSP